MSKIFSEFSCDSPYHTNKVTIVARDKPECQVTLELEYEASSGAIQDVGTQVWKGTLYATEQLGPILSSLGIRHVLELGCGIGICGWFVGRDTCDQYIATDYLESILSLAQKNRTCNLDQIRKFLEYDSTTAPLITYSLLDLNVLEDPITSGNPEHLMLTNHPTLILACDLVYDPWLTDNLLSCLLFHLLPMHPNHKALIVSERRLCVTLQDACSKKQSLDARGHSLAYFEDRIRDGDFGTGWKVTRLSPVPKPPIKVLSIDGKTPDFSQCDMLLIESH